jgi:hypothetical protein
MSARMTGEIGHGAPPASTMRAKAAVAGEVCPSG